MNLNCVGEGQWVLQTRSFFRSFSSFWITAAKHFYLLSIQKCRYIKMHWKKYTRTYLPKCKHILLLPFSIFAILSRFALNSFDWVCFQKQKKYQVLPSGAHSLCSLTLVWLARPLWNVVKRKSSKFAAKGPKFCFCSLTKDPTVHNIHIADSSYPPARHPSWWKPPEAAPDCRPTWRKTPTGARPPRQWDSNPPTCLWRAAPSPAAERWSPHLSASADLLRKAKAQEKKNMDLYVLFHVHLGPPWLPYAVLRGSIPPLISFDLVSSCLLSSSVSLGIPSSSSLSLSDQAKGRTTGSSGRVRHPQNLLHMTECGIYDYIYTRMYTETNFTDGKIYKKLWP